MSTARYHFVFSLNHWGAVLSSIFELDQLGQGHDDNIGDDANEMGDNLDIIDWGSGFNVADIACGYFHTCALSTNGEMRCCGNGMYRANGQITAKISIIIRRLLVSRFSISVNRIMSCRVIAVI